eukprot:UN30585
MLQVLQKKRIERDFLKEFKGHMMNRQQFRDYMAKYKIEYDDLNQLFDYFNVDDKTHPDVISVYNVLDFCGDLEDGDNAVYSLEELLKKAVEATGGGIKNRKKLITIKRQIFHVYVWLYFDGIYLVVY